MKKYLLVLISLLALNNVIAEPNKTEKTYSVKDDFFFMETNLPKNSEVRVEYLIPMKNGSPAPSASNIVFCAPYLGDRKPLHAFYRRYIASKLGFTVFSLRIKDDLANVGIREKYYVFKESGWHDQVFKAKKQITQMFNLEERNLLLVAASAGGSMAQQIVCSHPDEVDSIAICGGRFFDPVPLKKNIAWFAANSWGDHTAEPTKKMILEAEKKGIQVLGAQTPPIWMGKYAAVNHHSPSQQAWEMIRIFTKDVAALREANGGKMPKCSAWPVKKNIDGKTLYFPSEHFFNLWNKLPHKTVNEIEDKNRDSKLPIILSPPANPKKIVLLVNDTGFFKPALRIDDMYYFSLNNTIAYSIEINSDFDESIQRIKYALDDILGKEKWSSLPVYVVGWGMGGQLAAIEALMDGSKRIKKITTLNSNYSSAIKKYSISSYYKKGKPLTMMFDDNVSIPLIKNKNVKIVYNNRPNTRFLFRQWFKFLNVATDIEPKPKK